MGLVLTVLGIAVAFLIWLDQRKKGRIVCKWELDIKPPGASRHDTVYSNDGDLHITAKVLVENRGISPIAIESTLWDLYPNKWSRLLDYLTGRIKRRVCVLRGADLPLILGPEESKELYQYGIDLYNKLDKSTDEKLLMTFTLVDSNRNKYVSNSCRIEISELPRDKGAPLLTWI